MLKLNSRDDIAPTIIQESEKSGAFDTVNNKIYELTSYIRYIFLSNDLDIEDAPDYKIDHVNFNITIYFDVLNEEFVLDPKINQTIKVINFDFSFANNNQMGTIGKYILSLLKGDLDEEQFKKKVDSLIRRNIKISIKNIFNLNYVGSWLDVFNGTNIIDTMALKYNTTPDLNECNYIIKENGPINNYFELISELKNLYEEFHRIGTLYSMIELAKLQHNLTNLSDLIKVEPFIYDYIKDNMFKEYDENDISSQKNYFDNLEFLELFNDTELFNFFIKPYSNDIFFMDFILYNFRNLSKKLIGEDNILCISNNNHYYSSNNVDQVLTSYNIYESIMKNMRYDYNKISTPFKYVINLDFAINCLDIFEKENKNNYFVNNYDNKSARKLSKDIISKDVKDVSEFFNDGYDTTILEMLKLEDKSYITKSEFNKEVKGFPSINLEKTSIKYICRIKKDKLL